MTRSPRASWRPNSKPPRGARSATKSATKTF
nr:MAG TPA: hypothetical protein [Caudoviricetes sp.]